MNNTVENISCIKDIISIMKYECKQHKISFEISNDLNELKYDIPRNVRYHVYKAHTEDIYDTDDLKLNFYNNVLNNNYKLPSMKSSNAEELDTVYFKKKEYDITTCNTLDLEDVIFSNKQLLPVSMNTYTDIISKIYYFLNIGPIFIIDRSMKLYMLYNKVSKLFNYTTISNDDVLYMCKYIIDDISKIKKSFIRKHSNLSLNEKNEILLNHLLNRLVDNLSVSRDELNHISNIIESTILDYFTGSDKNKYLHLLDTMRSSQYINKCIKEVQRYKNRIDECKSINTIQLLLYIVQSLGFTPISNNNMLSYIYIYRSNISPPQRFIVGDSEYKILNHNDIHYINNVGICINVLANSDNEMSIKFVSNGYHPNIDVSPRSYNHDKSEFNNIYKNICIGNDNSRLAKEFLRSLNKENITTANVQEIARTYASRLKNILDNIILSLETINYNSSYFTDVELIYNNLEYEKIDNKINIETTSESPGIGGLI